ncbi:MAG: tol-pal system protein YbgF [Deltaproteobacteria bacterium]|jgi:tol-pal system protein YbgF|nr:tol-pal system protein YbgF [Deltaproteobacteria bacterium]
MRYFSLVVLCIMALLLPACSNKKAQQQQQQQQEQRQQDNERAISNLQVAASDADRRLEDIDRRLGTVSNEMSVLKSYPYPIKTTKGGATNFIASAPSMLNSAEAARPADSPLLASGSAPTSQPQNSAWKPSFPPPPPPPGKGPARPPYLTSAQNPGVPASQNPPPAGAAAQPNRPVGLNDLALPSEAPVVAPQPALLAPGTAQAAGAAGQNEEALYQRALAEFNAGRYTLAAAGFTELMHAYPTGRFAPNAGYWLGESLYGQGQYNDALTQFKEVTNRFPKHHKASDALLKSGLCYARLGDRENAAAQFRALAATYPNSSAANLARQRGYVQ